MIFQTVFAIFVGILLSFVYQFRKRKKQPPGPLGLPFVGVKPFLIMKLFFPWMFPTLTENQYFMEMRKKYGDIWSIDMGYRKIVVLASMDFIFESFNDNKKLFGGRPYIESFRLIGENRGISFLDNEICQANRQLAIRTLRDLRTGKNDLENQMCEQADELIENIENSSLGPIASPAIFEKYISNITLHLVFNMRDEDDDQDLKMFIKNMEVLMHSNQADNIIELLSTFIPLRFLRTLFPAVDKLITSCKESIRFIEKQCESRIKVESEFSKPNCVFDYFWRYRYQDYPNITYDQKFNDIKHSMFDIFFGGIDTTNNILSFGCLLLGQYQDVQEDIRNELRSLVDDYKHIKMEMRKNCPKLLSFMDEVHRFCVLCPRFFHRTMQDCVFKDYVIKSTDIVLADQATLMKDLKLFQNPNDFNAYRFVDETRTKYVPNKSLIPFGIGRRACVGESIAVMQLFLFFSRIIFSFDISLPTQTKDRINEIIEGKYSVIHSPLEHKIIFNKIH